MSDLKHADITKKIIGASFEVHKFLGQGYTLSLSERQEAEGFVENELSDWDEH